MCERVVLVGPAGWMVLRPHVASTAVPRARHSAERRRRHFGLLLVRSTKRRGPEPDLNRAHWLKASAQPFAGALETRWNALNAYGLHGPAPSWKAHCPSGTRAQDRRPSDRPDDGLRQRLHEHRRDWSRRPSSDRGRGRRASCSRPTCSRHRPRAPPARHGWADLPRRRWHRASPSGRLRLVHLSSSRPLGNSFSMTARSNC